MRVPSFPSIEDVLFRVQRAINGSLTFGDGTDIDNIAGKWYSYTTNAIADTEDVIPHNLGTIPVGILVLEQDKFGSWRKGATLWTTSNLYLKWQTASMAVKIFILLPPRTTH